jgi:PKD repeat protein
MVKSITKIFSLRFRGIYFLLILSLFASKVFGQGGVICGSDYYWQMQSAKNPSLYDQRYNYDMLMANSKKEYKTESTTSSGTVRIIPVVFHVIHNYGPENVSKKNILDQLATMNRNYQKLNSDTANVRSVFKDLIANCMIEFRLATKDPKGNCTDGIDRVASTLTYNGNDNVKSLVQWNPNKYLNIWVVSAINFSQNGLPPGYVIAGYAYFPTMGSPSLDGIVVRSDQVVSGNTTLTHEAGHYFNLYHTFESYAGAECGHNCNTSGDFICDTPPAANANFGCDNSINSCTSDNYNGSGDRPDMIENFMDYSNCTHMFSLGQSARMDAALINTVRANLYTNSNLAATGVDSASLAAPSCAVPKADFFASSFVVCQGGTISFTDNSFNAAVSSWQWNIPDASPATGYTLTSQNPVFYFPDTGYYPVTLKVSNANGSNQVSKSAYIHVVPRASMVKNIEENFEAGIPAAWSKSKDNRNLGWALSSRASFSGSNSIYLNNFNAQADSSYTFTIPQVDLGSNHHQSLNFKIAYARINAASSDVLRIFVADLCANNPPRYVNVYYAAGGSLVSAAGYVATDFVPAANEWKDVSVDLSFYKNVDKMAIKFWFQNHGGNNVYIDDINLGDATGIDPGIVQNSEINIYPNPASGNFTLKYPAALNTDAVLDVYDVSGKNLASMKFHGDGGSLELTRAMLNISNDGLYYIKLTAGNSSFVQKLVLIGGK